MKSDRSPKQKVQDCEASERTWATIVQISLDHGWIVSRWRQLRDAPKFSSAVTFPQHGRHSFGTTGRTGYRSEIAVDDRHAQRREGRAALLMRRPFTRPD